MLTCRIFLICAHFFLPGLGLGRGRSVMSSLGCRAKVHGIKTLANSIFGAWIQGLLAYLIGIWDLLPLTAATLGAVQAINTNTA